MRLLACHNSQKIFLFFPFLFRAICETHLVGQTFNHHQNMKQLIILTCALSLVGCVSQHHCVLLRFPAAPSPATVQALAASQPNTSSQDVQAWFDRGERGFILAASHTNEISMAVAEGATVKGVK